MNKQDAKLFAATLRKDLPTLDIHGFRVHEVREVLGMFIAKLHEMREDAGRIVYGFGTGALREATLSELRERAEIGTLHEEPGSCIFIFN